MVYSIVLMTSNNSFVQTVTKDTVAFICLNWFKSVQMDTMNIQMKLKHTDPVPRLS